MAATNGDTPKITLYTNHRCPWAHRAHIVVNELGLPYEEVIIDLDTPREKWYLDVNPRGLVPSLKFSNSTLKDEIITESGIVAQFLADAYPSHLLPASNTAAGALTRARINFFVDTWFSKAGSYWFKILFSESQEEKEKLSKEFVSTVGKEIEPLLADASPFFGGSEKLTLAEALIAPFTLRVYALSKGGLLPKSVVSGFDAFPNFSKWVTQVNKHESVTSIWDEKSVVSATTAKIEKLKEEAKAKA